MLMCRDLATIASDYIDGELSRSRTLSVKLHLMMCRDCRTFIGNLRASAELMKLHATRQVDEVFLRKIDERVADVLEKRKRTDGKDQ